MNLRCRECFVGVLLAFMFFGTGAANADVVVVPNAYASTPGGSNNGFPFNLTPLGWQSQRYQQVYDSSQFAGITGPVEITEIAFRPSSDDSGQAFSSTLPDIQIDLSTTSFGPNTLSQVFDDNVGPDDTVVQSGSLALSSSNTTLPDGTKAFDIIIILSTPFLYDPSQGNLLMDVRNFGGGSTTQFDAVEFPGPNTSSRVWSTDQSANSVNSPSGLADSWALVTQFTYDQPSSADPGTGSPPLLGRGPSSPNPEPSSLVLVATGLSSLLLSTRLRRKRAA